MKLTQEEQDQSQEAPSNEQETILFKNIDANVDKYSIELEKQIQKLPNPLRFIKKYIHFYFLPRLENILDELESIRKTPNYDEKVVQIRPMTTRSLTPEIISCIDLLNNNNIHHPKISKMVFGTMKGNLGVYDIDTDKIVIQLNLSKQNRVEHISTSTIKYFDTYQTRIAASCRGETNIYILSYNHSFTGITTECILNTINPEATNPPEPPEKINLVNIISGLKLSKDGYFLSVTDFAGGVRIFNFADIGIQSQLGLVGTTSGQINTNPGASMSNEDDRISGDASSNQDDRNLNLKEKKSMVIISTVPQVSGDQPLKFIFVGRFQCDKSENFTILPNEAQQVDDKNKKNVKDVKIDNKKKDVKKGGKGNDEADTELKNPEEYNIKPEFDEEKGDNSMYQTYNENHPWVHFVQKKFVFEDNSNSEYSTSTITVGLYIAFSNTTCFKFISLNEYITDKMKSIFKVKKVKNNFTMSIEDSMNLNSQMIKKEKDFLQFIRQKLDPKKAGGSSQPDNPDGEKSLSSQGIADKDKKQPVVKDVKKVDPKNPNVKAENPQGGTKKLSSINNVASLLTKKEMNFTTCFNITIMNGQKAINKYNNLLGIGMIDGSVLIWDCELHTDKFLFQKNSRFEITSISIDENYLICGTIKGQIYIYDLMEGNELFTCAQMFLSFFPFMNLGFNINNRICIYNSKESHKIGKLILTTDLYNKDQTNICFYNKYLCDYNTKYIVFICEKKSNDDKNKEEPKNILDLINFSKERIEILRNKPNEKITDFFNLKINQLNTQLVKVEEKPEANTSKISQENINEKSPARKKPPKDDKKGGKGKADQNNPPPEEEQVIEPVTKLDLRENVVVIYRVLDVLFKCYPNLAYSQKKGMSLKKVMKKYSYEEYPTYSAADAKKEGLMSIKYLTSDLKKKTSQDDNNNLKKDLTGVKMEQDAKDSKTKEKKEEKNINSTQRKDIFYNSFKNIKQRHQFKEDRINKLQHQKKKIIKDLKEQNNKNKKK